MKYIVWVPRSFNDQQLSLAQHLSQEPQQEAAAIMQRALTGRVECHTGPVELSVVLASDARMAELNQTWRGKIGPTDVLSFPMGGVDDPEGFPLRVLGDLIISLDTAQRQADERGRAPQV